MTHRSPYADKIAAIAGPDFDPRHVEAFLRLELGTLDSVDETRFRREVFLACACIRQCSPAFAESFTRSYGL
jgi:hypothetical protein